MTAFRQVNGRHGSFAVLAGDTTIAAAIAVSGGFAEGAVRLLAGLVRPGETVVDVGANIGALSVPLARRLGVGGRLIAFEPMRLPFLCLCANTVLNGLDWIEPRQQAVGAAGGEVALPPLDPQAPGNFGALSLRDPPGAGAERVVVVTIDSLALPALSLLKIDAEGMDWAVLAGAAETVFRCRPALYIEAGSDHAARAAAIRGLAGIGYRFWWHFAWFVLDSTLPPGTANPFPAVGDANLLGLPEEHWVAPNLAPVSAPDAFWRNDVDAFRRARPG
jgi:FkbM family methyltransferase